jgi:translation initiation factor 4A
MEHALSATATPPEPGALELENAPLPPLPPPDCPPPTGAPSCATESGDVATFENWDDDNVDLKPTLMRGIYGIGFETPSPIQKKAIIPLTRGRDIVAQAQSGTGKTGAFTVGILQLIDEAKPETQALILAPTRELAKQTADVVGQLSFHMAANVKLLIGGTSIDVDREDLARNVPHVVVGTPGRVHDMLQRGYVNSSAIKMLAIDEADEMLSQGFKDQVYTIFQFMPTDVQVGLFSATIPADLQALSDKFLRDPVRILVKQEMLTLQGIAQYYVSCDNDEQKFDAVKDIFGTISMAQCIIYCNSITRVIDLHEALARDGFAVICIHSDMSQRERQSAHDQLKDGSARVLIATDLFARGIDVQQVSYVLNFDVPKDVYNYIHRIGRSGRWGRKGVGINFVTRRDSQRLRDIERFYHTEITEMPMNFAVA